MKSKFLILLSVVILVSCENKIDLTPGLEKFDVSVEKQTVKVNEEVVFSFQGNPDLISFYSDEDFHQYDFRDGRVIEVDSTMLLIASSTPTLEGGQADQFSVLVSSNYKDEGQDYDDVTKADWTDITHLFELATTGFFVRSEVSISDYIDGNKPFVLAFRYKNNLENGLPKKWIVNLFEVIARTESLGDLRIGAMNSASFRIIEQYPDNPSKSTVSVSQISLLGADADNGVGPMETWGVSREYSSGNLDVGPDRAIGIKGTDNDMDIFRYSYTKPGSYDVVFVAKNANVDQEKEVIKTLEIIVEE